MKLLLDAFAYAGKLLYVKQPSDPTRSFLENTKKSRAKNKKWELDNKRRDGVHSPAGVFLLSPSRLCRSISSQNSSKIMLTLADSSSRCQTVKPFEAKWTPLWIKTPSEKRSKRSTNQTNSRHMPHATNQRIDCWSPSHFKVDTRAIKSVRHHKATYIG